MHVVVQNDALTQVIAAVSAQGGDWRGLVTKDAVEAALASTSHLQLLSRRRGSSSISMVSQETTS